MLNFIEFLHCLQFAVVAHTITLLMEEGHIFSFWSRYLHKKQWQWPSWLRKALGDCPRCFCGQVAFWTGLLYFDLPPFKLITFTAMVIFTTEIFRKWLTN